MADACQPKQLIHERQQSCIREFSHSSKDLGVYFDCLNSTQDFTNASLYPMQCPHYNWAFTIYELCTETGVFNLKS